MNEQRERVQHIEPDIGIVWHCMYCATVHKVIVTNVFGIWKRVVPTCTHLIVDRGNAVKDTDALGP